MKSYLIGYLNLTSTTGNVCREAFKDPELLGDILGINVTLIEMFRNILISINCQQTLNPELFQNYCNAAYRRYLELYGWFKMPATIHKVLAYGAEIMVNSPEPLGVLGKEASESRNKYYRRHHKLHARKCSRQANLKNVFNRALRSSDPKISSIFLEQRLKTKIVLELPPVVKNFLMF